MPFQHEKSKYRATEISANTHIIHKFVGISVVASGATCWSYFKIELYAVLLVMKDIKWNLCCSTQSYVFQQAGQMLKYGDCRLNFIFSYNY